MNEKLKNLKGQIGIIPLIGAATGLLGLFGTASGFIISKFVRTDDRINAAIQENVGTISRVATIEEAIKNIRDDQKEIKTDIKELIKLQMKK